MNLSPSSYNCWHTCNRLYYYEHVLRIERARQDGARRLGTILHAGLAAWWLVAGDDAPWVDHDAMLTDAMRAIAHEARHIDTDPVDVAKAEAMMTVYHARYSNDLRFESVIHHRPDVEVWYSLPLIDRSGVEWPGWRTVGKKDAIKRFADGRVRPVEHKQTSSEIHGGSDYWARLAIDTQVSMYVDATQRTVDPSCGEAYYDVVRRPALKRLTMTPEEDREYTKGKGCKECGGRAGGKLGIAQGTGHIRTQKMEAGKVVDTNFPCPACDGTGWKLGDDGKPDAPRLHKDQRIVDEPLDDFRARVSKELARDPDKYFRQGKVTRSPESIAEMRDDAIATTGVISAMVEMARALSADRLHMPEAAACFARNTQTCTDVYGRRCDFFDVCRGDVVDVWHSPLYRLKKRSQSVKQDAPQLELPIGVEP